MRSIFFLVALTSIASASPLSTQGEALYKQRCALCHPTDATSARGPGMGGIVGRKAGALKFGYTQVLHDSKIVWTKVALDKFLVDPNAMVPGTNMPLPTPDDGERKAIIAYLGTLHDRRTTLPVSATPPSANAAFGDWHDDAPGKTHHIQLGDLPVPFATRASRNAPQIARRDARLPKVPAGFRVDLFADGIAGRVLRLAPNGDIFVAETEAGRVRVLRAPSGATHAAQNEVFADGLDGPFGIAFYPPTKPEWVYVALNNAVVRYAYTSGDVRARGAAQVVVKELAPTNGGHSTRDVVFTTDGRMLVSVGSASNVAEGISAAPPGGPDAIKAWETTHGMGSSWGGEEWRADVLSFDSNGGDRRAFATGLRNCVGLAISPVTHAPWCATNERDNLGDDLVPDYVTHIEQGKYYGWPFYYIGDHEEPRLKGARPDLAHKATVPDVLVQPHSAALGIAFDDKAAFGDKLRNSAFVALHGSWNRARRTGYKVVRIPMDEQGHATGSYEDFVTGFVIDDDHVWGRPVGIAFAADGALLISEDGNATIWRIAPSR